MSKGTFELQGDGGRIRRTHQWDLDFPDYKPPEDPTYTEKNELENYYNTRFGIGPGNPDEFGDHD